MAAAVPTTVATLDYALRRYGTMSFAEVLASGDRGGGVGLQRSSRSSAPSSATTCGASSTPTSSTPVYLTGPTGESGIPEPAPTGTCVRLPGLADTLRRLAEAGPSDFYTGTIAARLDEDMRAAGGFLQRADLRARPRERPSTRAPFAGPTAA